MSATPKKQRLAGNAPAALMKRYKFLQWRQLPTVQPLELLEAMVAAVGVKETARRLARQPAAVQRWRTRGKVPVPVWHWLILAAANVANSRGAALEEVRWHYPKRKQRAGYLIAEYRRQAKLAGFVTAQLENQARYAAALAEDVSDVD